MKQFHEFMNNEKVNNLPIKDFRDYVVINMYTNGQIKLNTTAHDGGGYFIRKDNVKRVLTEIKAISPSSDILVGKKKLKTVDFAMKAAGIIL